MQSEINSQHPAHSHHQPDPTPPGKRRATALFCGAIVLGLIALGAVPRLTRYHRLKTAARAALVNPPLVDTVRPVAAPTVTHITLPGNVQAMDETTINAQTTGYVRSYAVDIGSHVHAGQLLAVIAAPEADQQLLGAQAEVQKSQASYGQSQADVSRLQAGVAQANASAAAGLATVQQALANVSSAQAKALQARSEVLTAQSGVARARGITSQRESDVLRARVTVELANKTLNRWLELGKVHAVSGQEVDEKQADYDSAVDNLNAAQAAVASARDDVAAARTQVESAQADARAAGANVGAARQQVDADRAAVQSAQAGVTAAQANVRAGQENVAASAAAIRATQANARQYGALQGFTRVVAPFEGVITARNIDVGTLVTSGVAPGKEQDPTRTVPQSGMFGIARIDTLRIQANVPQSFVSYLHNGQAANVTVPDFPGRIFKGKILVMSGALDASSRTMQVQVVVANPTGELIPGMYAKIGFVGTRTSPALVIPANTMIFDASGTRVAVVTADNKVHFQTVQVENDLGSRLDISSGLTGEERLISNPTDDLVEGEPVQVAEAEDSGQAKNGAGAAP